ncbi:MAG: hypothetical protein ABIO55_12080 [Ginsengibacter sp.]
MYFVTQSTFMGTKDQSLQDLQHIKQMMERSSRFISLSGLSGISAGICALTGAWVTYTKLIEYNREHNLLYAKENGRYISRDSLYLLTGDLVKIALLTFAAAVITSFLFTYLRSKKNGIPLWGATTFRLFWNTIIPLAAGGLFLLRSVQLEHYGLIAPGCLIFYGLALVNASKYTLGEVRYLGYGQILLGIINLWMIGYGLCFWAAGFGVLHIAYGLLMWFKYEHTTSNIKSITISE